MRPLLNRKKLGVVVHIYNTSCEEKPKTRGLQSRLAWAKSETLFPKSKRAGDVPGAAEHQPSKCPEYNPPYHKEGRKGGREGVVSRKGGRKERRQNLNFGLGMKFSKVCA
jgi:hypothetical protein